MYDRRIEKQNLKEEIKMLKSVYPTTNSNKINDLINKGNYKYLNGLNYKMYDFIEIDNDEYSKIQKISVDDNGNILGYFSADIGQTQRRFNSTYFVKFKYKYDEYAMNNKYDTDSKNKIEEKEKLVVIAKQDFKEFENLIFNHPIHKGVKLFSIAENPANAIYEKWMEKYDGERLLMKDYTMLPDGKLYDAYTYWFNCGRGE